MRRLAWCLEWGCREGDGGPGHSHRLRLLLPCICSAVRGGNSHLTGDGNQPCLVLVRDWKILEALGDLLPALREVVQGDRWAAACSQQGSDLLCPSAAPWRGFARADPAQRFHRGGGSEQPMKSREWAGDRRRGSAEQLMDQSSCNPQSPSSFSHFSYENQTENPKGS